MNDRRPSARRATAQPTNNFSQFATIACVVVIFVLVIAILSLAFCRSEAPVQEEESWEANNPNMTNPWSEQHTTSVSYKLLDEGRVTGSGLGRMTFSAVGDNLMNDNLLALADSWAGESGDNVYDFLPFYREISQYINSQVDVSFINQETTLGVYEGHGWAGYPSYNTPPELADAIANAGWRVVNLNTNHTYDTWVESIENAQAIWNSKSNLLTIGSYTSESDRSEIRVVECNGIRVAFLSYGYGQNSYEQSDLPNDYYAVPYDSQKMAEEVSNAKQVADAVVVYVHAGEEYDNTPSNFQREVASEVANAGAKALLFSHSHVIEPVEWVSADDGSQMICAYGLGDFVSGYYSWPDTIMSGMITFDFVRDEEGAVNVENVVWHPLIEHISGRTDEVRFYKNYTSDEASENELLATLDDPYQWMKDQTLSVIGSEIQIDW